MKGWHCINKEHTSESHATLHNIRAKSVQPVSAPKCPLFSLTLKLVSPQARRSAPTWQAALAPLWLFSATNYLMSSVSGSHRERERTCGEKKKKTKLNKSLSHYTADTAHLIYSTSWTKLSAEDSAASSHDNQRLNHCLMQNSTFSDSSWNF